MRDEDTPETKDRSRHPVASYDSNVSGSQVGSLAVGDQSRAITIINGLTYDQAKDLFSLLWEQNFPRLAESARDEARRRVGEFAAVFTRVAAAQGVTEDQLGGFIEPDVQFMLNSAIQASARRGSPDLWELLARLIVRRLQARDDEMMALVLGEAASVAGKLASSQLHVLALCFLTMDAEWFEGPITWTAANRFLQETVAPFMATKISYSDLRHLQYAGCGDISRGPVNSFHSVIAHRYPSLFKVAKLEELNGPKLVPSTIEQESPILRTLSEMSRRTGFYLLNPTSIGFVLAVTTVEQVTGKRLAIEKWVQ